MAILRWAPDDSPFAAAVAGGRQWLGWGIDRYLSKQTADILMSLATGFVGGEFRETVPIPESRGR